MEDIITAKMDYGKLALQETTKLTQKSIVKDYYNELNVISFENYDKTFSSANKDMFNSSFMCDDKSLISLNFCFVLCSTNATSEFEINVVLNGKIVEKKKYSVINDNSYNDNFCLFGYSQSEVKIVILSSTNVVFKIYSVSMKGRIKQTNNFTTSDILVESKMGDSGMYALVKQNDGYHYFGYSNANNFLQNFNCKNVSSTKVQNVVSASYSVNKGGSVFYNDELFLLYIKNDNLVYVRNLNGTKEKLVGLNNGVYCVTGVYINNNSGLAIYNAIDNKLKIAIYDLTLTKVFEKEYALNNKNKITKLVPIKMKTHFLSSVELMFSVFVITGGEKIYAAYAYMELGEIKFKTSLEFLDNGHDISAVNTNNGFRALIAKKDKLSDVEYKLHSGSYSFKKQSASNVYNYVLGVLLDKDSPVYYKNNYFV